MSREIISIEKGASILEVAKLMEKHNISSLIVVDRGEPIGIVTERDLVRKVLLKNLDARSKVKTIMSSPLITVDADEDVARAAEILVEEKIRRLPVVEEGKLVGIVTETNISQTSPKAISEFSSTIEKIDKILKDL
jgi:CBS domain-containing protein